MTSPLSQPLASNPRRPDIAPADPDSQSVAGEEDPGASLDLPAGPDEASASQPFCTLPGALHPGADAAQGTPGTGPAVCRDCGGSGRVANGPCAMCAGSGTVPAGLGGA